MATTAFGIRIMLQDHRAPIPADTSIGLRNQISNLAANVTAGTNTATVENAMFFTVGEVISIIDNNHSEENYITHISGDNITFATNFVYSYTTAASGKVCADSRFQWMHTAEGDSSTWKTGIILQRGISKFGKSIDLSCGGNIAQATNAYVRIDNSTKIWKTFQDAGIYFPGMVFEIWEYLSTEGATRRWFGKCEEPVWDSMAYEIRAKSERNGRDANITKQVAPAAYPDADENSMGKAMPVHIGELRPIRNVDGSYLSRGYAKALKVTNKEISINARSYASGLFPADSYYFSVRGGSALSYSIRIGWYWLSDADFSSIVGKYLYVSSGSKSVGKYRRITGITDYTPSIGSVTITIASYFEDDLDTSSVVQIVSEEQKFIMDTWPCDNFIDESGSVLSQNYLYYVYENGFFQPVPFNAYKLVSGSNNKELKLDNELTDTAPGTINAFYIYKLPKDQLHLIPDTGIYGRYDESSTWTRFADGFFVYDSDAAHPSQIPPTLSLPVVSGFPSNINTQNNSNKCAFSYDFSVLNTYFHGDYIKSVAGAFAVFFNNITSLIDYDFDACYLGIYADQVCVEGEGITSHPKNSLYVYGLRGFSKNQLINNRTNNNTSGSKIWKSLPDDYYIPSLSSNNAAFYNKQSTDLLLSGYENYATLVEICGKKDLSSYTSLALVLRSDVDLRTNDVSLYTVSGHLGEICFLLKKRISVSNELFIPFRGRTFNDTWGSRKTSTNLIQKPLDILEHLCRLQNWGECSPRPANGWGLGYGSNAKIKLSGTGSFDEATIKAWSDDFTLARGIYDYDSCYTTTLKKSLCRNARLASWVDANGYECIARVHKSETAPTDSITLADIPDRRQIKIEPMPVSRIFCEPYVQYNWNAATQKYQSIIKVSNASADVFDASYVDGKDLTGEEAEELWNRCHALWLKCHVINPMPSELADLVWANGPGADDFAYEYITEFIDGMDNPSISFPAHYNKVKSWEECKRFTITLPHQTNGIAVECMLTRIEHNPYAPYISSLSAIMLTDLPADFSYRDTMTTLTEDLTWQDTMTTYGDSRDKQDVT